MGECGNPVEVEVFALGDDTDADFQVFIWICLVVKRLIHPTVDGVMTMSRILASPHFQVEAWIEPPFSRSVLEGGVFVDGDDEFSLFACE